MASEQASYVFNLSRTGDQISLDPIDDHREIATAALEESPAHQKTRPYPHVISISTGQMPAHQNRPLDCSQQTNIYPIDCQAAKAVRENDHHQCLESWLFEYGEFARSECMSRVAQTWHSESVCRINRLTEPEQHECLIDVIYEQQVLGDSYWSERMCNQFKSMLEYRDDYARICTP